MIYNILKAIFIGTLISLYAAALLLATLGVALLLGYLGYHSMGYLPIIAVIVVIVWAIGHVTIRLGGA